MFLVSKLKLMTKLNSDLRDGEMPFLVSKKYSEIKQK